MVELLRVWIENEWIHYGTIEYKYLEDGFYVYNLVII